MIDLCWWHSPSIQNWGDDINPQLFEWITGGPPSELMIGQQNAPHYLGIGSILTFANANSVVWGSGIMARSDVVNPKADIRSVRGKLSRRRLLDCGGSCPEVFGDPALLFPKFYDNDVDIEYELGVIPHFVDFNLAVSREENLINVIDIRSDIFKFVDEVRKCKRIVSSSLHGLIVADSYGIPSQWVKFSNRLHGDGVKFLDHFSSIDCRDTTCINIEDIPLDLKFYNKIEPHIRRRDLNIDLNLLLDSCPF